MHSGKLFSLLISMAALPTLALTGSALINGPWLQNVSEDAITIMWESNGSTPGSVNYSVGTDYGATQDATTTPTGSNTYINKVRITGLTANSTYNYKVDTFLPPAGSTFRTAPDNPKQNFTIGVFGDTHEPIQIGSTMMNWMMDNANIAVAYSTGDICSHAGNKYSDVTPNVVKQELAIVSSKVPLYVAMGNHDVHPIWGGGDLIRKYFDQPKELNTDAQGFAGSFVTSYGGVASIFIDWNRMGEDIGGGWMEEQLLSPLFQNARFRFVFIHNSPYYERWRGEGESDSRSSIVQAGVRDTYVNLLLKYNVHGSFSGHMHGYERGQKTNSAGENTYFTVSGGGSYLDAIDGYDDGTGVTRDWDYDFITQGAHENTPQYFNYGRINQVVTIEIKDSAAISRMHGFSPQGNYYGVLDSFVMIDDNWNSNDTTPSVQLSTIESDRIFLTDSIISLSWNGANLDAGVKLELLDGTEKSAISSITTSDKTYEWTLPETVPTATTHRVVVTSLEDTLVSDTSNSFTVVQKTPDETHKLIAPESFTAEASSEETANEDNKLTNAFDLDMTTMWHTLWGEGELPHTVDWAFDTSRSLSGITYLARQDNGENGTITDFTLESSDDSSSWSEIYTGTFDGTKALQTVTFEASQKAKYARLSITGSTGSFGSASEIMIYEDPQFAQSVSLHSENSIRTQSVQVRGRILHIGQHVKSAKLSVTNFKGQIILQKSLNSGDIVNLSNLDLASGVYMINISAKSIKNRSFRVMMD